MRIAVLVRAWLLSLLAVSIALTWVGPVLAGSTHNIDITAQGSDNGTVPGPPEDFDAVLVANYEDVDVGDVEITWTKGSAATDTIIRGKVGSYPDNYTDGYPVYDGDGIEATDWIDLSLMDAVVYYRAWSWNVYGYSALYAEDFVEGGGIAMGNVLLLFPIVGLLAGMTVFGDWRRSWPAIIMASFGWFLLAGWGMMQSDAVGDGYFILAIVSIGIALFSFIWPLTHRPAQAVPDEEDDDSVLEEMRKGRKGRKAPGTGRSAWE